jgi:hypothetical protein
VKEVRVMPPEETVFEEMLLKELLWLASEPLTKMALPPPLAENTLPARLL